MNTAVLRVKFTKIRHFILSWHQSLVSVVVFNTAGVRQACGPAAGRVGGRPPGRACGRPTLHGGPVGLRPVRATPCFITALNETLAESISGDITQPECNTHPRSHRPPSNIFPPVTLTQDNDLQT